MRVAAGWSLPLVIIVVVLPVTPSFARPQAGPPIRAERTIRDLVDSALLAPPELAADVLLKLIERGHVVDRDWKRELIETAWSLAPRATYAFEVEPAVATTTDSDPGSLSAALVTGLSAAGIQARIIEQMAKLDPKATREMFLQMSPPAIESPACSADRYTSHRAYFKALDAAVGTFSPDETKKGERARFLAEGLRVLNSPEDFELSADLLLRSDLGLTNNEFALLMASWVEMLGRARFTDRLFSSRSISAVASTLIYRGKESELRGASAAAGLRAFRTYFVTHARAGRCGESRSQATAEEGVRVSFNKIVGQVMPGIPLITAEEIKPESFGETAKVAVYTSPSNEKVWKMKLDYSHLRFGTEEQQAINDKQKSEDGLKPYLTIEQRSTPEWSEEALRFLNQLETWSREFAQDNREIFFQKAEWHGALVYVAPDGKLRHTVLDSYVRFLATSPIERESPPEWAMWLNRLIGSGEVPDRRTWLDQIEAAGDPAVAVYCQLARLSMLDR